MNKLIREYLDLVNRIVHQNDLEAFQKLEQMEHEYPELGDAVHQSAGPMSYDFHNNVVITGE